MIHITALYAGILGLFIIYLAKRVTDVRQKIKCGLGDNGDQALQVAIRAHANALEYIPIALILIAFAEMNGWSAIWIHSLGGVLVAGRFSHGYGFTQSVGGSSFFRFWGTALTWLTIIVASVINIISYFL